MAEFRTIGAAAPQPSLTPSEEVAGRELGGFDFSNVTRNERLVASVPGAKMPKAMKTGTTICGVVFAGGVVLGADTRATEDTTISDKNCAKIHYIAPNIYCCGAGTAADTEQVTRLIASQLELLRLQTRTPSRVVAAMTVLKRHLFKYQGHVSAALVLGGVDITGGHLYNVYPHGSTDKLPYITMGSGSLAAMSVLETGYSDDMTEAQAVELVSRAIAAGIFNDLGSGSNVDITVIRAADTPAGQPSVEHKRGYQILNDVAPLRAKFTLPKARIIPRGATVVLAETFTPKGSTSSGLGVAARSAPAAPAGAGRGGPSSAAGPGETKMELE